MRIALVLTALAAGMIPLPAAAQSTEDITCTVGEVAVNAGRVHVYCSNLESEVVNLPGTIRYFAVEIGDPLAPHLVTIASAATVSGRRIALTSSTNAAENPGGCLAYDCRRLLAVKGIGA